MSKEMLVMLAAGTLGPVLADKFVIRYGPNDNSGFLDYKPGFGLEDVAIGAIVVGVYVMIRKVL